MRYGQVGRAERAASGRRPAFTVGSSGVASCTKLPVGEVDDGAVVARALLLGAHLLHRLDDRILVGPQIHLDRRRRLGVGIGAAAARRRRGAEEEARAVLREARRRVVGDDHALRACRASTAETSSVAAARRRAFQ